jgi:PAS domain S-box-containing protein
MLARHPGAGQAASSATRDPICYARGVKAKSDEIVDPPSDGAPLDYRALFESAPDAILIADDQGRYVAANASACELFGVPLHGLLGKRVTDFVAPEELQMTRQQWSRFRAERSQSGRFPLRRPDGQARMLEYNAVTNAAPGLHVSILRDVTEYAGAPADATARREPDWTAPLTRLLDWEVRTPAGRYAVTAAIIAAATGLQWLAWPLLKPLAYFMYFPALTLAALCGVPWLAIVLSVLAAQAVFVPHLQRLDLTTAAEFLRMGVFAVNALLISAVTSALRDSRRKTREALAQQDAAFAQAQRTIASLKKAEAALKESELLLREQFSEREQFVAGLSHDLRTPLQAVRMAAQLAGKDPRDAERIRTNVDRIVRNVDKADRLIGDLLDASRVRAGQKLPLEKADCDLAAVARSVLAELAEVHGDRFVLRAPAALRGRWDGKALGRALENLAGNAVKYGANDAKIEVDLAERDGEVELSVTNHGNPLPPEELGRLFQPYHRGAHAQATGRGGWGIGLTLVKGVAEAHGGTVSVTSSAASGTTFTLKLPR